MNRLLTPIKKQLTWSCYDARYDWSAYEFSFRALCLELKKDFKGTVKNKLKGWNESELLEYFNRSNGDLFGFYKKVVLQLYFDSINQRSQKTLLGPIVYFCPYCDCTASYQKFDKLNRRLGEYGYICDGDCDASVGFHIGDKMPLGILANKPLRALRSRCKKALYDYCFQFNSNETKAYHKMASLMNMNYNRVKISRLNYNECEIFLKKIKLEINAYK